jgi:hypothetical protein
MKQFAGQDGILKTFLWIPFQYFRMPHLFLYSKYKLVLRVLSGDSKKLSFVSQCFEPLTKHSHLFLMYYTCKNRAQCFTFNSCRGRDVSRVRATAVSQRKSYRVNQHKSPLDLLSGVRFVWNTTSWSNSKSDTFLEDVSDFFLIQSRIYCSSILLK